MNLMYKLRGQHLSGNLVTVPEESGGWLERHP
jgi:hypothetical protein